MKAKAALIVLIFLFIVHDALAANVSLVRELPAVQEPGTSLTVTLKLEIDNTGDGVKAVGITEIWPSEWALESVDAGGYAKNSSGKIEVIYFSTTALSGKEITYKVRIPEDASGTYSFGGEVIAVGAEGGEISGDKSIRIEGEEEEDIEIDVSMPSQVYAGEETRVTITEEDGGDEIEDVRVRIYLGSEQILSGRTDGDGVYEFIVPEAGEYGLEAEKSGYEDYSGEFTALARETSTTLQAPTSTSMSSTTTLDSTAATVSTTKQASTTTTSITTTSSSPSTTLKETTTSLAEKTSEGILDLTTIGLVVLIILAIALFFIILKAKR